MTFKELTAQRYSVRNFTSEPIDSATLDYILDCARLAPSAVNFQPWHFYVVGSQSLRCKLHECYNREWFQTAPLYIVACICHGEEWVRRLDQKAHGNIDIAIAVEHLCLAAAEQGLGTCWVCNFDAERCHAALDLPADVEPAVLIPIGHIAPESVAQPKQRKSLDDIVTRML